MGGPSPPPPPPRPPPLYPPSPTYGSGGGTSAHQGWQTGGAWRVGSMQMAFPAPPRAGLRMSPDRQTLEEKRTLAQKDSK
eukprot:5233437-Pyramimonas_sp.AAC.1